MRYQANIDGWDVEVETISDGFEKAIAQHEFPNTNGALLENLGQKGRTVTLRCYFFGKKYAEHFDFLESLDDARRSELVHPVYGLVKGEVKSVNVRHSDRAETAEIDLTFVEGRIEAQAGTEISMPGAVETAFLAGQKEQQAQMADDTAEDLGTDGASAAAQALDPDTGILAQFASASAAVRAYVGQVEAVVATLEGTLVAVTQPANTLLAAVSYAADLPGRVIGSIAQCVERYAESYNALRSFPAQFQRSLKFALGRLETSVRAFRSKAPAGSSRAVSETAAMTMIANHIKLAAAHRLSLEAAYGFSVDQVNRQTAMANEGQKSFDALGNYFNPVAPDPLMTMNEIEATLASVMTAAQDAVDLMRGIQQVKNGVASLVSYARLVKLDSERIVEVDIDGEMPLHLILLKYGLPYNAAERVLAINPQIKHPNFVSGTVKIYVR